MGIKLIIVISSLAAVSVAPSSPEPEIASTVYEEIVEDGGENEIPDVPSHSCDPPHHDNFFEVASLASASGFPGPELHTAVAVAYAESLGDAEAVAKNRNGSKDSGLWQINSIHGYSDLKNPHMNAQAAFEVWSHTGWTAWYAHTPRGGEYGSGERFIYWLKESQCTIDFYHEIMVYYKLLEERTRGDYDYRDALPEMRQDAGSW